MLMWDNDDLLKENDKKRRKPNWHRIALYLEYFEKTSAILIVATWNDEKRDVHIERPLKSWVRLAERERQINSQI